jgi:crotonobetainyl-CoA:carnitine CoA-transferase CaiB-like acyl-CoA transferase
VSSDGSSLMSSATVLSGTLPFAALRVVELCDTPAGEQLGKLVADLGAEVIKVEPPGGVTSRRHGPFRNGPDGRPSDQSLAFWSYNSSKRSVVLGDSAADRDVRDRLIASADVLLTTGSPSELAEAGLDLEALVEQHERLIAVSTSGFGLTGPWRDYLTSDLVGLAAGGPLASCGYDDHEIPPILPGGGQAFQTAASFGYCGLLVALIEREQHGRGQLVDVSMHEANAVSGELANPYWFYPKALVQRQTCRHAQPIPTQPALFQCSDDVWVYFALILADQRSWKSLVAWMDDSGLAADLTDPAFDSLAHRQANFSHVQEMLDVFFLCQSSEDAYTEGQRRGLPIGPLRAFEDLPADEHLQARGFFVEVADEQGAVTLPGLPYRFSAFAAEPGPAPRLGADQELLASANGATS